MKSSFIDLSTPFSIPHSKKEMTELEHYINSYFRVQQEDIIKIASFFKPTVLKKGEYFIKTGKQCEQMSFVQSGFVRVYAVLEEKEVTHWISSKGYFVTDLSSLVFGSPSKWMIQALTDTELHTISKADYNRITERVPQWPLLEKLFIVRCFSIMEDRIFSHLSMSAEERYQYFFNQNRELFNQVPLQYLASMLGMTPETFSRIRKKQLS
jgi:CRP/FNR family transcriptional regulator, anaerobic regulatory protein